MREEGITDKDEAKKKMVLSEYIGETAKSVHCRGKKHME